MGVYRPCVGSIIINSKKEILVGNRIDHPTCYQMPQGGTDGDSDLERALKRELYEELSLFENDILILRRSLTVYRYDFPKEIREKRIFEKNYVGQEQTWFLCSLAKGAKPSADTPHPEFLTLAWMPVQDVLIGCVAFKKPVYTSVFKEFGLLM